MTTLATIKKLLPPTIEVLVDDSGRKPRVAVVVDAGSARKHNGGELPAGHVLLAVLAEDEKSGSSYHSNPRNLPAQRALP
jgi:hypothetical protein